MVMNYWIDSELCIPFHLVTLDIMSENQDTSKLRHPQNMHPSSMMQSLLLGSLLASRDNLVKAIFPKFLSLTLWELPVGLSTRKKAIAEIASVPNLEYSISSLVRLMETQTLEGKLALLVLLF